MAGIVVHGIPGSPFLRSVEITLKEKAAPYQLRAMSPADMKTPAHLAMHPFGRIPMFEQGDFTKGDVLSSVAAWGEASSRSNHERG